MRCWFIDKRTVTPRSDNPKCLNWELIICEKQQLTWNHMWTMNNENYKHNVSYFCNKFRSIKFYEIFVNYGLGGETEERKSATGLLLCNICQECSMFADNVFALCWCLYTLHIEIINAVEIACSRNRPKHREKLPWNMNKFICCSVLSIRIYHFMEFVPRC